MNTRSLIRLQPSETPQPTPAPIPADSARFWRSPFEGESLVGAVKVFITQPAYTSICAHAGGELDDETGGILVGQWYVDTGAAGEFIVIEEALPARHTRQGSVFLTFTQDTIVDFHNEIEERFPGKQIVGWYHTHPRMGIFFSHYDTWLHNHFFPEAWQVALVIEPHQDLGGLFIRQVNGSFDPARYFGFYELETDPQGSIVHWNNLQRAAGDSHAGGETQ